MSHLSYNGDTFRANILIPDTVRKESDSDYGGGIGVLNNETGEFTYRQRPFVFRAICFNGNIWDRADGFEFNRRHIGTIDWAEFRKVMIMNLQEQIPLVQKNIEKVLALKGIPITQQEIEGTIVYLGKRQTMTDKQVRGWYDCFKVELQDAYDKVEGSFALKEQSTIDRAANNLNDVISPFGIVQGLTRSAREGSLEAQEMMEAYSARLIDENWDKVLSAVRATTDQEKVEKVLRPQEAKK